MNHRFLRFLRFSEIYAEAVHSDSEDFSSSFLSTQSVQSVQSVVQSAISEWVYPSEGMLAEERFDFARRIRDWRACFARL